MKRIYWSLGAIAVVCFGLARCWHNDGTGTGKARRAESSGVPTIAALEVPTPVSVANQPKPTAQSSAGAAYDDSLIGQLHKLEGTNPELAISLAMDDRQRNPKGPDAEERDMVLVAAHYNNRDLPSAKAEAWYYFVHYPNGRFTNYLSKLTGIEPPKNRPQE